MPERRLRRVFIWIGVAGGALTVAGIALLVNFIWFKPVFIRVFFDRVFIEHALKDPELLTTLRLLEPVGINWHNDDLTDATPEFEKERLEKAKRDLAMLRSYNYERQNPQQQLSTDILDWYLDNAVRGEPFLYYNYPVNQLFGVQNDLPTFMATLHQVNDAEDAEHYVRRLTKFYEKFQQVLKGLQVRTKMKIIPPQFILDRVIDEMQRFVNTPPEESILYTAFEEKLNNVPGLSRAQRSAYLSRAEAAIRDDVIPAYERLTDYCIMLRDRATTEAGAWKLPNGDAYYAYRLRSETTTSLTPEEVHQFGLDEVERISAEMHAILEGLGRTGKTVGKRMRELQADPQFRYPDSDEGRAQCLADYQAMIDEIDTGLGDAFDLRPAIGVKVERVPEFKEKTAPGAYYNPPALDGSRPGVFYANLRDMNEIAKWGMRTLAYHEAIPGHHFQLAVQQQIKGPIFRKVLPFTAYTEGWALYAERLAWELGFHEDPFSNLGRLQAELFRAARLVVDTGIHHKRWTREEAIAYMAEKTGMGDKEVQAEIERYIVNPGQACAYKIGMMKILELREKARSELGGRFTLKGFHNAVLANGAMPMEVLEKVVNRYITSEKQRGD